MGLQTNPKSHGRCGKPQEKLLLRRREALTGAIKAKSRPTATQPIHIHIPSRLAPTRRDLQEWHRIPSHGIPGKNPRDVREGGD